MSDEPKDVNPPKEEKPLWISCRGKQGCEGRTAQIVFHGKMESGIVATRYRCLTCKGSWTVQTGGSISGILS